MGPSKPTVRERAVGLRFLVLYREREYKPLPGLDEPRGPVCVARCLPGGLWAWGPTREAAFERLYTKLHAELCRYNDRTVEWYEEKMKLLMTAPQCAEERDHVTRAMFTSTLDKRRMDGYEFVDVKDDLLSPSRTMASCRA